MPTNYPALAGIRVSRLNGDVTRRERFPIVDQGGSRSHSKLHCWRRCLTSKRPLGPSRYGIAGWISSIDGDGGGPPRYLVIVLNTDPVASETSGTGPTKSNPEDKDGGALAPAAAGWGRADLPGAHSDFCLIRASPEFGLECSPDHASTQRPGMAFLRVVSVFVTIRSIGRGLLGSRSLRRDCKKHDE